MLFFFRRIYSEAVTAIPVNGGTYNVMLNTTNKKIAAFVACLSILSYVATAIVSAFDAMVYLALLWQTVGRFNIYFVAQSTLFPFHLMRTLNVFRRYSNCNAAGAGRFLWCHDWRRRRVVMGRSVHLRRAHECADGAGGVGSGLRGAGRLLNPRSKHGDALPRRGLLQWRTARQAKCDRCSILRLQLRTTR